MRKLICPAILICALLFPIMGFAQTPQQIAGIRLGGSLDQYKNILQMDTALPVRHMEYISEVELKPSFEGYRSGYIFYGNCDKPGRIVKIKLKYERSDKEFFDDLVNRFKQKFGNPDQYKGDAFRAFIAWKWSFKDKDGNNISLILQHNSADVEEYTRGNSVKLTATSLIEKEARCEELKTPEPKQKHYGKGEKAAKEQANYQRLIPE
jgi:hypothetical protein